MTLLLAFVVVSYSSERFIVFVNREDTNFQEAESVKQFNPGDGPTTLGELDFTFEFRLVYQKGGSKKVLDKTDYLDYLSLELVSTTFDAGSDKD